MGATVRGDEDGASRTYCPAVRRVGKGDRQKAGVGHRFLHPPVGATVGGGDDHTFDPARVPAIVAAHRPAVRGVGKGDTAKMFAGARLLVLPVRATVRCGEDGAVLTH